jgi:hypothetical protein
MPRPDGGFVFSLSGKACVVTGASRGLGRAIALAFADRGADVVLGARSRADLDAVAHEIEAKGRRGIVQPTDVTDLGQIQALADAAVALLRSRRGGVGVGCGPSRVRGRRDDERPLPLPDAGQPGRRLKVVARVMVPDADARRRRRDCRGTRVLAPVVDRDHGLRDFTIADPDGSGIRFATRIENPRDRTP